MTSSIAAPGAPALPFGPFVLDRLLGVGGTAEVFVAHRSEDPDARFVVKRIRPELASNEEFARRMELEAQIASRAGHPNLIRFLEYGQVGQCRYIVFEHVRGYALGRALEEARRAGVPLDPPAGLVLARSLLGALSVMHGYVDASGKRRPVLHRDVTPNNIVLTLDGRPVLIDLGIAKDVLGPAITQIGKVIGTARYMSPEHKLNEFLDERTDVFSASVVLFEAFAGHPPWPKLAGAKELLRTVFDAPELDEDLTRRVPREILDVLVKGLSCDRADRYSDAAQMLVALEATRAWSELEPSDDEPFAPVRRWIEAASLKPDEELEDPVVRSAAATEAPLDPVRWTSDGRVAAEGKPSERPSQPAPAQVLEVPPLPPARHDLARTRDIRITAEIVPARRWPMWAAIVVAVLAILALLLTR
ncbi:MAG: serine/threonine protein kinase [Deltaproteobacteria bacterium]|nr:serine/threonine protein kinase [Deltaproteobacteria bacterium]